MKNVQDQRSAGASIQSLVLLGFVLILPVCVLATAPQWWNAVIDPTKTASDYSAANQGQVKNFALQAYNAMQDGLPGGAGTNLTTFVENLPSGNNYQAINLGQLKSVAKPFYDRLIQTGYATNYPWTGSTNSPSDYSLANLGQLKNIFNFNLPPSTIAPVISSPTTISATLGTAFSYTIAASNFPLSFNATGLPPGLSINTSTGVISGLLNESGTSIVTLTAANGVGSGTATLTLIVNSPISYGSMTAAADVGDTFSYSIASSYVPNPTSYTESGALPAGLSFNSTTGVISGTSTATGTTTVTIGVSNGLQSASSTLTFTINPPLTPVITSPLSVTGTVGVPFSYTISASHNPTSFGQTGTLPSGLTYSAGVISGTPTAVFSPTLSNSTAITVTASNSAGTGSAPLTFLINPPAPVITSSTNVSGTIGTAVTPYTITATNSPATYGATGLPPGLNINGLTGVITGSPALAGTWTAVVNATNAGGTGMTNVVFTIGAGNAPVVTRMVADGDGFSYILHSDGTVWASGYNDDGELGNGGNADSVGYTRVLGLPPGIIAVAGGINNGMALSSDGTVWTWGYGADGELGNGQNQGSSLPVQVPGLNGIIAIASGDNFEMALRNDGTVWTWGDNSSYELGNGSALGNVNRPVQVSQNTGLTKVVAIAAGNYHALAIKSDGTVWAWGNDDADELGDELQSEENLPEQVAGLTGMISVAAGYDFSLALKNDGTVWAWGNNDSSGFLGNGNTTSLSTSESLGLGPAQVLALNGITAISSSGEISLALKSDGTVWAWGDNTYGEFGNGTTNTPTGVPNQVPNLKNVVSLSAGYYQDTVIKSDGSIYAWGVDLSDSEIGAGGSASTQTDSPSGFSGLGNITAIAAARGHYLALKSDGTVWTWGDVHLGDISNGTTITGSNVGVQVPNLGGITAIACGEYFNLALKNDGTVWAWGQNPDGELGDGTENENQTPEPVLISTGSGPTNLTGITAISCAAYSGFALKSDGTVWAWGRNSYNELGDGTTNSSSYAEEIPTFSGGGVSSLAGGIYHIIASKNDGTVWTWGANYFGELGNGSMTNWSTTPTQVSGINGITSVAAGYYHCLARKSDGTVWSWGLNTDGELGNGTATNTDIPAQISGLTGITTIQSGVDSYHSIAIKSDGTVWAWGDNANGQFGVGSYGSLDSQSPSGSTTPVQVQGLNGVTITALACGKYSTIALANNGAILQWGDTSYEPSGFSMPILINDPQVTAAPMINPAGGSFSTYQTVSISNPLSVGQVHYTLDGTVPTASSTRYSGSFVLNQSAMVKATVIYNNSAISPVTGDQFYINDSGNTGLAPAPSSLSVNSVSGNEIDLSWTVSGSSTFSQVDVYRSTNGGAYQLLEVLGSTATTFDDTSVVTGNTYSYKVGTGNQAGVATTAGSSSVSPVNAIALTITVTTPAGATNLP